MGRIEGSRVLQCLSKILFVDVSSGKVVEDVELDPTRCAAGIKEKSSFFVLLCN